MKFVEGSDSFYAYQINHLLVALGLSDCHVLDPRFMLETQSLFSSSVEHGEVLMLNSEATVKNAWLWQKCHFSNTVPNHLC
jgi:hypothetical protein